MERKKVIERTEKDCHYYCAASESDCMYCKDIHECHRYKLIQDWHELTGGIL